MDRIIESKLLFKCLHLNRWRLPVETVVSFQSFEINFFFVVVVAAYARMHRTLQTIILISWNSYIGYICGIEWIFFYQLLLYTEFLNEHFYYLKSKNKMSTNGIFFSFVISNICDDIVCTEFDDSHVPPWLTLILIFVCLLFKGNGSECWVAKWEDESRLFFLFRKIKYHSLGGSHVICLRLILSKKLKNV